MATVLILGANGRVGRETAKAFLAAGWTVRAFVRPGRGDGVPRGATLIEGDALSAEDLAAAAEGAQVIFNGLNQPYTKWRRDARRQADAVLEAARRARATHLFPGNVYNYGEGMPARVDASTPYRPTTAKGRIRVEMEEHFRRAAGNGVQTLILRAGDFYGGTGTGSWFDLVVAKDAGKGKVTYPGPLEMVHSWAYLPDLARAFVVLAEKRGTLGRFEDFRFSGHSVTGRELIAAVEKARGTPMKTASLPWWTLRIGSLVSRQWSEVLEMSYLWRVPHALTDDRFEDILASSEATPFEDAVARALADLGIATRETGKACSKAHLAAA